MALVSGQVLDAAGQPVAGAVLVWAAGPVALPDIALLSADDGRFTLAAPAPGRYTLACRSDTHGQTQATFDVAAGTVTLLLRLPR